MAVNRLSARNFRNPNSYEIGAEFLTARVRWGTMKTDNWFRGYNQFYITAMAEPIFRGVENHYFGLNFGSRYNFVRPGTRFVPYISVGLGLGWIDSHPGVRRTAQVSPSTFCRQRAFPTK